MPYTGVNGTVHEKLFGARQGNAEDSAFAEFAFDVDAAVHAFENVLNDGKAEAGAADGARAGFINTIEALEDAGQIIGWNADARISNCDANLAMGKGRQCVCALHRASG